MRLIHICGVLAGLLSLSTITTAQNTSVGGQIIAPDGTPWLGILVNIQNTDTGDRFDVKTGKDGRYTQWGLRPGNYKITICNPKDKSFAYYEIHALRGAQENDVSINFSKRTDIVHSAAQNDAEKETARFNNVKSHFNAGVGAMLDAQELRAQLSTASTDQKAALQEKLDADYETAIADFLLAEQSNSPSDVETQTMIWGRLGEVYDYAGHYQEATNAYRRAVEIRPDNAIYYENLSKAQASLAMGQTDSIVADQQLANADANCDKAALLDPIAGAKCWKNIGILLTNKNDLKRAVAPLKKATQLEPKDAQSWFLLGNALLAMFETKQQGNVRTAIFPAGTAEVFQKCIDADPNGPYASRAKELIDGLAAVNTGKNKPQP